MDTFGLYYHIPFCRGKCPYCDFYSVTDKALYEPYLAALLDETRTLRRTGAFLPADFTERVCDTVYCGGGTPSEFGGERLAAVLNAARERFTLAPDAEITVECNPSTEDLPRFFAHCAAAGVNRVSMGLQSAVDAERKKLGRRAAPAQVTAALQAARAAGIRNLSLDLMLGIPLQTEESLRESLDFLLASGVQHASVYLLSLEEGTYYAKHAASLALPGEDSVCDMYLQTCEYLARHGLRQYEISNFAAPGFESRHNTRYWRLSDYLGLGAAAHSCVSGQRFRFAPSIAAFCDGGAALADGAGGGEDEYVMLAMRLTEGLTEEGWQARYAAPLPAALRRAAAPYAARGLLTVDTAGIRCTPQGFLVSNTILADLLSHLS